MTDQEMMNEALKWQEHIGKIVTATDDELYHKRSKIFDWLIEQAERVQELENHIDHLYDNNVHLKGDYRLQEQNKRYREALVKLRNDIGKIKTGYEKNTFVIKTVDDALIDWEALE